MKENIESLILDIKNCPFEITPKIIEDLKKHIETDEFHFTKNLDFVIYGSPKAWKRASPNRMFSDMYDPNKPIKNIISDRFVEAAGKDFVMIQGPVLLYTKSYKEIPKSFSKTKALMGELGLIRPTTKPDVDNYSKLTQDAINNIIYRDDAQIVDMGSHKFFSFTPRVEIHLEY
jgi:Holliday junction resolvase RusA-like endonuclease